MDELGRADSASGKEGRESTQCKTITTSSIVCQLLVSSLGRGISHHETPTHYEILAADTQAL